ncbi:hypothetical protein BDY19DRAFT_998596 [Irpex rosettiformis]|uniref:Uncharacterized protein n=1 Tax=Irpex rosettiformis TaxID=378272 RepID=A0ACB8TN10_9APHY|nr:hypothetical protein BDY19DRAFT_998596 [Irpex rosettiformis]
MAQQAQLQETSRKHLSHTMEENGQYNYHSNSGQIMEIAHINYSQQDPPTDLNQATITEDSAASTFRHEQPMIKEQEIKIDRPDLPDDDEPPDRLHAYLAWIRDVTHKEVIPETPEPMDTDEDNNNKNQTLNMSGTQTDNINNNNIEIMSTEGILSPSEEEIESRREEVSIELQEGLDLEKQLADVSRQLQELLRNLPATDTAREIFQAAYHQSTAWLIHQQIRNQELSRSPPQFRFNNNAPSTGNLARAQAPPFIARDRVSLGIGGAQRHRQQRKHLPNKFMNPAFNTNTHSETEEASNSALATLTSIREIDFADDTVTMSGSSVTVEPRRQEPYSQEEILELLRDLRDETSRPLSPFDLTEWLTIPEADDNVSTLEAEADEPRRTLVYPSSRTGLILDSESEPGMFQGFPPWNRQSRPLESSATPKIEPVHSPTDGSLISRLRVAPNLDNACNADLNGPDSEETYSSSTWFSQLD